jgi:RNA ligase
MIDEYGKILTLFERNEKFKVVEGRFKSPAFELINKWHVEEKIHGQNVRIHWNGADGVFFFARTAGSGALPGDLLKFLESKFTVAKFQEKFAAGTAVALFGEGCGAGIQKNGGLYSKTKTFVLFDVKLDQWWFDPDSIRDVAAHFDVQTPTVLYSCTMIPEIVDVVKTGFDSFLAFGNTGSSYKSEGIIARTVPGLFMRDGSRLMFKLKTEDFAK